MQCANHSEPGEEKIRDKDRGYGEGTKHRLEETEMERKTERGGTEIETDRMRACEGET